MVIYLLYFVAMQQRRDSGDVYLTWTCPSGVKLIWLRRKPCRPSRRGSSHTSLFFKYRSLFLIFEWPLFSGMFHTISNTSSVSMICMEALTQAGTGTEQKTDLAGAGCTVPKQHWCLGKQPPTDQPYAVNCTAVAFVQRNTVLDRGKAEIRPQQQSPTQQWFGT